MTELNGSAPQVRPFFGFYGGKWRDALKHYPAPQHDTIVEPFAGSAGYALRYYDRKVILCDLDPVLAGVWSYLIKVKPQEILRIPDLAADQTVDEINVCQEARWLIGFWLNRGVATPRRAPSKWMRIKIRPGSFWGERVRTTLARQVETIRHWKVHNCSYANAPTPKLATWFIDPPYQRAGQYYRYGSARIDYAALSAWCQKRKGQVIVCENQGATWLPFEPLASVKTTRSKRSKEAVWISDAIASRSISRKKKRKGATNLNVTGKRAGQLKAA